MRSVVRFVALLANATAMPAELISAGPEKAFASLPSVRWVGTNHAFGAAVGVPEDPGAVAAASTIWRIELPLIVASIVSKAISTHDPLGWSAGMQGVLGATPTTRRSGLMESSADGVPLQ